MGSDEGTDLRRAARPHDAPAQAGSLARVTDRYIVATDGACKGNPGPTGWAWVGEDGHWAAGSILEGTNNIGELMGLLKAIEDHPDVEHLVVQAESEYAIDTYSKWMDGL